MIKRTLSRVRDRYSLTRNVKSTSQRSPGAPGPDSESGETLLEVLLALIILSLASVALITAFGTSVNASAEHRSLANFDTVLASSIATTTSVVQQQYASVFSTCQPLSGYPSQAALTAALGVSGFTAAIAPSGTQAAVEYSDVGAYTTSCSAGTGGDVGNPQLINVVVTDTATGFTQNDTVVVDNPTVIQTDGAQGSTANSLVFITEPEGATVNAAFTVQPQLEVQDCNQGVCTLVTSDLSPITLTLASGPPGSALSQTCTGQETAGVVTYSGCSLNVVGAGYVLYASENDPSNPGLDLTASSTPFSVYATQLVTPTITNVAPSTATAGAINVSFTGAKNAPGNQVYSVKACTDSAMSANCVVQQNFASGNDVTGLMPGLTYYVEVTAVASQNFLGSTSPPSSPATMATVLLNAPAAPTVVDGTSAGTLVVTFTGSSNAPTSGQTYTLNACPTKTINGSCVTNANFVSGGTVTVPYTPGTTGPTYFVEITANASTGYLASTTLNWTSQAVLSTVKPPTNLTASPSPSTAGAIYATFTKATGTNTYTATVYSDAALTNPVLTVTNYTSGGTLSPLTQGATYYVTITEVSTAPGLLSATIGPAPAMATVQLLAPVITVGYGSVAGSISISGGSSNAVTGVTYSARVCTGANMTGTCTTENPYVPGADYTNTNLTYTAGTAGAIYYATLTALNSAGFLGSAASNIANHADTSQFSPPGTPSAVEGPVTTPGSIVVTFAASPGVAPVTYTAEACTQKNSGSGTCIPDPNSVTAGQFTFAGLKSGSTYYVYITANAAPGFVASNFSATYNIAVRAR